MEDYALLFCGIEVQPMGHGDIDEIGRRQAPIAVLLQIIRGVVKARPARGREKEAASGIVVSPGKELHHQKGMGGAAYPQIDLNGVMAPPIPFVDRYEIDSEAAHHAFLRQDPARTEALVLDRKPVRGMGREAAAEKDLRVPAAQDLIMR